ncbi:hypothetical protein Leryth_018369 [Lithospermum erythrorhizon]|nr:hypothetical protein Leryth_018369 [Lithospermum erythrorhizon]
MQNHNDNKYKKQLTLPPNELPTRGDGTAIKKLISWDSHVGGHCFTRAGPELLVTQGITRAFETGQKIRTHLADVSIHRGFVSPFLRCLQTAAEAVSALVANVDKSCFQGHASKIKIQYLSENLLLVTHAAGVLSVLQELKGGADGAQVEYCGYLYLKRPIYPGENKTFTAGQFELVGL